MKKQPKPWAEDIEKAIAKARLEERTQLTDKYYYQFRKVEKALAEALAAVGVLLRGDEPAPKNDKPAPKRGPVKATGAAVEAVGEVLAKVRPIGTLLTIRQIWEGCPEGVGLKQVGAALRLLATDHHAVEEKRGLWRAPEAPAAQTADGATSEAT